MTARGKGKWPVAFQQPRYDAARKAYEQAIDQAMDQMIDGKILNETIENYKAAISTLDNMVREDFQQRGIPATDTTFREATNRLREMEKSTELMKATKSQSIMAAIDQYKGKNVNDLRVFMLEHNLRFAEANSFSADERNLYIELFGALDEVRTIVIGNGKGQNK